MGFSYITQEEGT